MKKKIKNIIKYFDFESVNKVMIALDWKWGTYDGEEIPSIETMKTRAKKLLKEAYKEKTIVSTGGFEAECNDDVLGLRFVVGDMYMDSN